MKNDWLYDRFHWNTIVRLRGTETNGQTLIKELYGMLYPFEIRFKCILTLGMCINQLMAIFLKITNSKSKFSNYVLTLSISQLTFIKLAPQLSHLLVQPEHLQRIESSSWVFFSDFNHFLHFDTLIIKIFVV